MSHLVSLLAALAIVSFFFSLGLQSPPFAALRSMRGPLLLRGLVVNLVVVPLVGVLMIPLFGLSGYRAEAIILLSVAAGAPIAPQVVKMTGGLLPFAIGLTLLLGVITPLTAPATANLFLSLKSDEVARVPVGSLIGRLILLQIVPLCIGLFVRARRGPAADRLVKPSQIFFGVVMLVVFAVVVVPKLGVMFRALGWQGAAAAVLSSLFSLGFGWALGGIRLAHRKTLAAIGNARNIALALLLTSSVFPDVVGRPVHAIVAAMWLLRALCNFAFGALLKRWQARRAERQMRGRPAIA